MSQPFHQCDEGCRCPVHGAPLLYAPARGQHACADITCRYAHGLEQNLDDLDRYVLEQGEDFWDLLLRHERDRLGSRSLPLPPEELGGESPPATGQEER